MKNLRKKIATVTKEEAIKELTNIILKYDYECIDSIADWFIELCDENEFNGVSSFDEFLEKSESEQNKILKNWFIEIGDDTFFNQILEEDIGKNKNLSDKEKEIYFDAYDDAVEKSSLDKQYLETFKRKLNKRKENWNVENTVNPDFHKGMNKINCIRTRLQKKLS